MTLLSMTVFFVAIGAMVCSYGVTSLVLRWAGRVHLQDVPNERSMHTRVTPRGGGIGIVLITLTGLGISYPFEGGWTPVVFTGFFVGALITAAISLWDDTKPLSPKLRLAIQILVAAGTVWSSGFATSLHLSALPGWNLTLPAAIVGVLWMVGFTNAYNFMDGIDGIAGLQGVVAGLGWALIGWHTGLPQLTFVGVLLGSASLGFLGQNWHPARIFMGDVGSTFLGFSFAALALIAGAKNPWLFVGGVLLVFPFVFDSSFTFLRRLIGGEDVFQSHRKHIYQRMVTAGLSHDVVASLFGLLSALGAVVALILATRGSAATTLLLVQPVACICLFVTVAGNIGSLHTMALDKTRISRHALSRWLGRLEKIDHINRVGTWTIQAMAFAVSGFLAFLLRFDLSIPRFYFKHMWLSILIWVLVKSLAFRLHGLDRGWWRYVSIHDLLRLTGSNITAALCSMVFIAAMALPGYPRSVYLIDFLLTLLGTIGIRLSVRIAADLLAAARADPVKRVLIYGAGRAGTTLAREIRANSRMNYQMVGFVDDDQDKRGLMVHGARILGTGDDLVALAQQHQLDEILISLSNVSRPEMSRILESCQRAGLRCRTIPPLDEVIENRNLTSQIRDVDVEDLLGRSPVQLDEIEISHKLKGKVVMVTGAAGSIGSELCRQIARYDPQLIVGFEISETALFFLAREMQAKFPDVPFVPCIGSIQNRRRLNQVFTQHRPAIVYHAAAYKHVPLMEDHVTEAIENNIFGTYQVAAAAAEHGTTDFVMISSDKAVRPVNVMGATKRAAELVIGSMHSNRVKYVSVRFGNVLGSNGSVVPLFKEQIANGGPVTVTDPDMERYFMTIPEASQLVLQASTMGQGDEIFVLDMGLPVKIIDLARNLIRLSGFQPDHDIKIKVTGARPGEKLREELQALEENTVPTRHPKIKIFRRSPVAADWMTDHLNQLEHLCLDRNSPALVDRLKQIVPEYRPEDAAGESTSFKRAAGVY